MIIRRFLILGAMLIASGCRGGAGDSPLPASDKAFAPETMDSAVATQTLPTFKTSFTFQSQTFPVQMVGRSPSSGVSTTIPVDIVPVKLTFANGIVLDGSSVAASIAASPLFTNQAYLEGTTQYADAIMRSEWWKFAQHNAYHVFLAHPAVEPETTIAVPAGDGTAVMSSDGTKSATLMFAYFMNTVEPALIKHFAIKPTTIAIFATVNTRLLETSGGCCFNGYHGDLHITTATGPAIYLTVWGLVSSKTLKTMDHIGHETAELLNDPFYTNHVPPWRFPNLTACGDKLLEVGDPVVLDTFTAGGYSFEDAAFYSWFSRDVPSIGISGRYDLTGKLKDPAISC